MKILLINLKPGRLTIDRRRGLRLVLALVCMLVLGLAALKATYAAPQACVPSPHSGIISADEEWCFADSPHLVEGGLAINNGATVTVEPGVEIRLSPGAGELVVNGGLVAEGTPTQPITFTAQTEPWAGILAYSGSVLQLGYCDVGYASGDYWHTSLSVQSGADVQISHCRIHHMAGSGLNLQNDGLTGTFEDLEIDHNSGDAVLQNTLNMNPTFINLQLHDNGLDAVNIPDTLLNQDVLLDGSPAALNGAPFYLGAEVVTAGYTFTVTPGTMLKMREGSGGLYVYGVFVAEGTPAAHITFTAQSGNWAGMVAYSGSQFHMTFCDVDNAGGDYSQRAMEVGTDDATIRNCLIHHSKGNGLNVTTAQVDLQNLALIDNTSAALWIDTSATVEGQHLTVARNGTGVYIAGGSTATLSNTIIAENTVGVKVESGGSAILVKTLWDGNAASIVGEVDETGHIDGLAKFAADGYHILPGSEAIQRGITASVSDDIDGDPRPMPPGTAPDLGADENSTRRIFNYSLPVVQR